MIIIICIIDQLTNWRCPGLGPGSASKEFVEEGEREQRPRGLWDVSNTCSWIKVGLEVGKSDLLYFHHYHHPDYLGGSGRECEDFHHGI